MTDIPDSKNLHRGTAKRVIDGVVLAVAVGSGLATLGVPNLIAAFVGVALGVLQSAYESAIPRYADIARRAVYVIAGLVLLGIVLHWFWGEDLFWEAIMVLSALACLFLFYRVRKPERPPWAARGAWFFVVLFAVGLTGHYWDKILDIYDTYRPRPEGVYPYSVPRGEEDCSTLSPSDILLTLMGSTTIGEELAPQLAANYLADPMKGRQATDVRIVRCKNVIAPGQTIEYRVSGVEPAAASQTNIVIVSKGSTFGLDCLKQNTCDVGMTSAQFRPEDVQKFCSDMTPQSDPNVNCENFLGNDGIVIVVNKKRNTIKGITRKQLQQLYCMPAAGAVRISQWNQLDTRESSETIDLVGRSSTSGTAREFYEMVLDSCPDSPPRAPPQKGGETNKVRELPSTSAVSNYVSKNPTAMGYLSITKARDNKMLQVSDDGMRFSTPSHELIQSGEYLFHRGLFFYVRTDNPKPALREFVSWALSRKGQTVVDQVGFVGQLIPPDPKEAFHKLPVVFYFAWNKNDELVSLNSQGNDDFKRLLDFLKTGKHSGNQIAVYGFADPTGAEEHNVWLGYQRAMFIAGKLRDAGFPPAIISSMGPQFPVITVAATGEAGRDAQQRNRRVQVWVGTVDLREELTKENASSAK
jgi:phosphate transport system substrate-binding protein